MQIFLMMISDFDRKIYKRFMVWGGEWIGMAFECKQKNASNIITMHAE